jgi:hypothetical protein
MKTLIKNTVKSVSILFSVVLAALGSYNAVFLNSLEFMQDTDIKFAKRLDEINGRIVAAQSPQRKWVDLVAVQEEAPVKKVKKSKKRRIVLKKKKKSKKKVAKVQKKVEPVISNDLDLQLVEIYNAKKFKRTLRRDEFSGELYSANGVIDNLVVNLPDGDAIEVSYAQMSGNVFNYEQNGKNLSGMMYEVGRGTYMVTLTNGPYSGTRMKFKSDNLEMIAPAQATVAGTKTWADENYGNSGGYAQDEYDRELREQEELSKRIPAPIENVNPQNQENLDHSIQANNQQQEYTQEEVGQFGFNFSNNENQNNSL